MKKSVILMSTLSSQPPVYPAVIPMIVPTHMDIRVAIIPTISDALAPFTR